MQSLTHENNRSKLWMSFVPRTNLRFADSWCVLSPHIFFIIYFNMRVSQAEPSCVWHMSNLQSVLALPMTLQLWLIKNKKCVLPTYLQWLTGAKDHIYEINKLKTPWMSFAQGSYLRFSKVNISRCACVSSETQMSVANITSLIRRCRILLTK